nr:DUF4214 domain-containing protein [Acidimicrobiia bacterium]
PLPDGVGTGIGDGAPDDAGAAADVDAIRPGDGFAAGVASNWGAYRFQLVLSSAGNIEAARVDIQSVADELTRLLNISFVVDPGTVSCAATAVAPACPSPRERGAEHWPVTEPPITGSGAINAPFVGIIRVQVATSSPCGDLAGPGGNGGTVGCAGPSVLANDQGDVLLPRGSVWLAPALFDSLAQIRRNTIAHEVGHALGLDHFNGRWPLPSSTFQLMLDRVHSEPSDLTGVAGNFHSGDRNGLWFLHNPAAWYITATYRDFLGRIPDKAGYDYWSTLDVSEQTYVSRLTNSQEWIGRIVDGFYGDVFGRPADAPGRAFWTARVAQRGVPAVASELYSSPEYFTGNGGSNAFFVNALYADLLGRVPSAADNGFWEGQVRSRGRQAVALDFFQSYENRTVRVRDLYCTLLDRGPEGSPGDSNPVGPADDGWTFWARQILTQGDLALATSLATSNEYFNHSDEYALRSLDGNPALPAPCQGL